MANNGSLYPNNFKVFFIALLLISSPSLHCNEPLQEAAVDSIFPMTLSGKPYSYKAVAGNLVLKDEGGNPKASLFYTAYFLMNDSTNRPLTFCFNGGPGAASVWLNTGFIGPKRINGKDAHFENPPYILEDNADSLIDQSDLVFIDPISTGLSIAAPGIDAKSFYSVDEDVQLIVDFIRQFTLKYKRSDSPKYILGESYGGMRAVKAAYKLHNDYAYYVNGLILISPALDLETIYPSGLNDLPYLLALPTMSAMASYHGQIKGDVAEVISQAKKFMEGDYAKALFKGTDLSLDEKREVVRQLKDLTNVPSEVILRFDLKIPSAVFTKELMQSSGNVVGRFDGRIVGLDSQMNPLYSNYDPSLDAVIGAMTGTYNQYLSEKLKWPLTQEYRALVPISSWNWGKGNSYGSCLLEFEALMAQNPKMHVIVMEGLFDLACPFSSVDYALSHAGFSKQMQSRISVFRYPSGHMMYFNQEVRNQMRQVLQQFFIKN